MGLIFSLLLILLSINIYASDCGSLGAPEGEYIIQLSTATTRSLKTGVSFRSRFRQKLKSITGNSGVKAQAKLSLQKKDFYLFIDKSQNLQSIKSYPDVLSVEKNCYVQLSKMPNDVEYSKQWALKLMDTEKAWDITTGSSTVIVAVSDTGVDYNHSDLHDNMWVNNTELNGQPNIDDDDNGFIDDVYGYDFANNDGDPKPGTSETFGHGTHVAGIIGAVGNNEAGITGLAWNVKLMALKGFYDDRERTTKQFLIQTIYYAVDNGAHIINCSWVTEEVPQPAMIEAINYAHSKGVLVIVAAGNESADVKNFSPAGIKSVITVGAHNSQGELSIFSNYGFGVDLFAPGGDVTQEEGGGESIWSTYPNDEYRPMRGTSMSAPMVAGIAALILSYNKGLSRTQAEDILKASGPKINAYEALKLTIKTYDPQPCPQGSNCNQSEENASVSVDAALNPVEPSKSGGCHGGTTASINADYANKGHPWIYLIFFLLPMLTFSFLQRSTSKQSYQL